MVEKWKQVIIGEEARHYDEMDLRRGIVDPCRASISAAEFSASREWPLTHLYTTSPPAVLR